MECSKIEHYEDPDMDWRSSFQQHLADLRGDLATYSSDYLYRKYGTSDIEKCARIEAIRRTERAIIQYDNSRDRRT